VWRERERERERERFIYGKGSLKQQQSNT